MTAAPTDGGELNHRHPARGPPKSAAGRAEHEPMNTVHDFQNQVRGHIAIVGRDRHGSGLITPTGKLELPPAMSLVSGLRPGAMRAGTERGRT